MILERFIMLEELQAIDCKIHACIDSIELSFLELEVKILLIQLKE
ncbi:hypothetical protein LCGC14_1347740 [marine sediment metagenome]|uniref:Uncharacterized protein n=1 Tax=marine sediment metagenome TaxID=412755 RepID=A0A0F9MSJ2_9ZZZZ